MRIKLYNLNKIFIITLIGITVLGVYLYINKTSSKIPDDAMFVKNVLTYIGRS